MQAEIPQSIFGTPMRWGRFTTPQLGWLVVGAALPYLLLRLRLEPSLALLASLPWLISAVTLAFGRHEGRHLDAWVGDWVAFRFQPHQLHHPGLEEHGGIGPGYFEVDIERALPPPRSPAPAGALPWEKP
ncbi:MAG: hypothetical protein ABSF27_04085 [Candidatus Dormibacteria bacterium]|jgi:hypothetical protein